MTVLCATCRYGKKYCTGNKASLKGVYHYEMEELDMPDSGLYLFYKCVKRKENVNDPTKCEDYEPLPKADWSGLF